MFETGLRPLAAPVVYRNSEELQQHSLHCQLITSYRKALAKLSVHHPQYLGNILVFDSEYQAFLLVYFRF